MFPNVFKSPEQIVDPKLPSIRQKPKYPIRISISEAFWVILRISSGKFAFICRESGVVVTSWEYERDRM